MAGNDMPTGGSWADTTYGLDGIHTLSGGGGRGLQTFPAAGHDVYVYVWNEATERFAYSAVV